MADQTTRERVERIVREHLGVAPDEVRDTDTFEDYGADSLDVVELVMAIEEEFGIEVTDAEGEKHVGLDNTIPDVVAFVDGKLTEKAA